MKCPHCLVEIHAEREITSLGGDSDGYWAIEKYLCPNPNCRKRIFYLVSGDSVPTATPGMFVDPSKISTRILVRPKGTSRPPVPPEVPREFAEDYKEACLVLPESAKASAALSRRCLQNMLRDAAKVKPSDLYTEIQEVLDSNTLPSHLADVLDTVRVVGNFSTHPIKSEKTGEIIPVEPEEAEWNLDVLEALFDFYFVQPEKTKKKKQLLNEKLKEAGKKELK